MEDIRRRPSTLAEMREYRNKMVMPEEFMAGLAFIPQPDDIIISPFGKCGTTWTQQIVHTLRTKGDMEFDDISTVVPWIETAVPLGIDLEAPQKASPRAFKSHAAWDAVPKGARYIVPLRDPKDATVSMFKFMEGWFLEPGAVDVNEFALDVIQAAGSYPDYWSHLLSWWPQRNEENILLLSYEAMLSNRAKAIERIAEFINIALDADLLKLTLDHSSIEFMLQHKEQFSDVRMRQLSERRSNLPSGSDSAKVRQGKAGSHQYELSHEVIEKMDSVWATEIEPKTGFATYQQLVASLVE